MPDVAEGAALEVFDVAGRRVAVVASGRLSAGESQFDWDGSSLISREGVPAGIYFLRLKAGPFDETRRFTVLR
jgi:hypothetical protein